MNRFFNMDNKFFVFMGRVADLLLLNFLCILCCIPVVTAGASITALYYVTLKMARDEESYIARSFFRSFKQNFKQATIINMMSVRHLPLTLLMLVISASPLLLMWLFAYVSYAQFTSILIMLFILMGFSTLAYWKSKIFVKIFDNYIPKDENEENGEEKNEPKEA